MKKILSLVSALAIGSISATSVVACGTPSGTKGPEATLVDMVNNPTESKEVKDRTDKEIKDLNNILDGLTNEENSYKTVADKGKQEIADINTWMNSWNNK